MKMLSQSRSSYSTAGKSGAREGARSEKSARDCVNRLTPDTELRRA